MKKDTIKPYILFTNTNDSPQGSETLHYFQWQFTETAWTIECSVIYICMFDLSHTGSDSKERP